MCVTGLSLCGVGGGGEVRVERWHFVWCCGRVHLNGGVVGEE